MWQIWMLIAAVVGAEAGLWYPWIVGWWKNNKPLYVFTTTSDSDWTRALKLLIASLGISVVVVLIGFVPFLGNAANQTALEATGFLAFVAAFTYGFTAGSLFEEPLKK